MSFAETFRTARIAKKLTQQQIADELNLDRSAISHYETGMIKPHFDNINKICELLDLTYEQIFKEWDNSLKEKRPFNRRINIGMAVNIK